MSSLRTLLAASVVSLSLQLSPRTGSLSSSHSYRFVNPPTFTTWRKSRPVSSRRMAEGDSGELSAFYYPIQDSGSGEVGGTPFLLRQNSGSGVKPRMKVWPEYVESPDREVQERKFSGAEPGSGQRTAALLLLQKARIDQLKKSSVQSEKSYQTFADKMFNGKNSHHQTKPVNLPAFSCLEPATPSAF